MPSRSITRLVMQPVTRDITTIGFRATPPTTPINSVAPVASGTASVGSVLSVTNGSWSNSPTSYTYQWQRQ